jgi:cytochrome bd-type quinol oxidase subunit 1
MISKIQRTKIQQGAATAGVTVALLLPVGAFLAIRRRYSPAAARAIKLFAFFGLFMTTLSFIAGCSSTSGVAQPFTPKGAAQVVVTATSGSISKSSTINLTVQ